MAETPPPFIRRQILARLEEALGQARVVVLNGPRQAGKTTIARRIAATRGGTYWSLDAPETQSILERDPTGLLDSPPPVVLDEFQIGGDRLLRAIKQRTDESRAKGRYLLTGSTRFTTVPTLSESLAGRAEIVDLWPLSQGEMHGGKDRLIDLLFGPPAAVRGARPTRSSRAQTLQRVVSGGYPDVFERPDRARRRWYEAYVRTVTERDVSAISRVQDVESLRRLLKLLATRTAQELNLAHIARDLDLPRSTITGYLPLLETLYLVFRVPAWSRNLSKKVVRHPKVHFVDSGLAADLLGADAAALANPGHPALGPLLETFVAGEVKRQATWAEVSIDVHHFRDHGGAEVDLVLEARDGRVVGIEVKASSTVEGSDFKGLDFLHARLGSRFAHGVVLYLGDAVLPFGDRRTAMPITSLSTA
jgi:predicted AAA+ superfamily ATPase